MYFQYASQNAGTTTIKPLLFIMAMKNIRINNWFSNPQFIAKKLLGKIFKKPPSIYLIREMLGWLHEKFDDVNLSEVGHIENLVGVYELFIRRCKYIVVSDGEPDPDLKFEGYLVLGQNVKDGLFPDGNVDDSKDFLYYHNWDVDKWFD